MYNKEATAKMFRRLKARSKVGKMHFKVKMRGASKVIVCKTYEFTIKGAANETPKKVWLVFLEAKRTLKLYDTHF